jgi:thioredoxin 1
MAGYDNPRTDYKVNIPLMLKQSLLCGFILLLLCGQALHAASNQESSLDAYGAISADNLLQHYPDFAAEYAAYTATAADIARMQTLSNVSLLVLFGSWCHDSEREVPRLLKLLTQSAVALDSLQLQAVNRQKQDPDGMAQRYQLRYTPTIIVLRDGSEIGRIVEQPTQSLASELADIAGER